MKPMHIDADIAAPAIVAYTHKVGVLSFRIGFGVGLAAGLIIGIWVL